MLLQIDIKDYKMAKRLVPKLPKLLEKQNFIKLDRPEGLMTMLFYQNRVGRKCSTFGYHLNTIYLIFY
jgi:hypothetical protein